MVLIPSVRIIVFSHLITITLYTAAAVAPEKFQQTCTVKLQVCYSIPAQVVNNFHYNDNNI